MRARRDWRFGVLLLVALALASACATPPKCQGIDQCLAVTQIAVTEARDLATDLLARREISASTAQAVQDLADQARLEIATARGHLATGDYSAAQAAADLATRLLAQAETRLKERR